MYMLIFVDVWSIVLANEIENFGATSQFIQGQFYYFYSEYGGGSQYLNTIQTYNPSTGFF